MSQTVGDMILFDTEFPFLLDFIVKIRVTYPACATGADVLPPTWY